ncbi:SDR family NAD(P)-dependent oxidoreductase [Alicyclobacillus suci]|uniref:SDR family NAD(P)-dependent oxidoreductase n=1 Tax=Alicyclobacillus suci TaxID=2816080 RepID=UPI001A8E863E|nr:SDR family NAD(P)-dependent oxidoreductase [Alicyclobacillus suci]
MEKQFQNKVAVITGGTSGIGLATAIQLVKSGAKVVVVGRSPERGAKALEIMNEYTELTKFIPADMGDEKSVRQLFEEIAADYGHVDMLFNNAGIEGGLVAPLEWSQADVDALLEINVKGVYLGYKYSLPMMLSIGKGVVVNTASFVGTVVPVPDAVMYGATKAAVVSMTKTFAVGFADQGIQSFAVCPWVTDTSMVDRLTGFSGDEAKVSFAKMLNPSGTLVRPEYVANVVLALFSGNHGYQNGEGILVDSNTHTPLQRA